MDNVLVVKCSAFGDDGQSSRLTNYFVDQLQLKKTSIKVINRDVNLEPIPHLDIKRINALFSQPSDRTAEQSNIIDFADELLQELLSVDAIILAMPMYNFSIPSQLKSWFDHLARAGVSFKYTETGPVGLLEDKPVYILAARGGIYNANNIDFQTPFVTQFFNLLGLKQLHFVYAEGLNLGDDIKEKAIVNAMEKIDILIKGCKL